MFDELHPAERAVLPEHRAYLFERHEPPSGGLWIWLATYVADEIGHYAYQGLKLTAPDASASPEDVNGHRFLPSGDHRFSPTAAMFSPRWWPSGLPSALSARSLRPEAEGGAAIARCAPQARGVTPLPAVAWASR
jgi:hypothetical protein